MAIGLGFMMGFDFGVNFLLPYQSKNITEFWRRWHISLSSWLRDYLYIPLGGNRKGKVRTYINLFITMFLGGLWHGASWKFVFWGAWHGIALAIHKFFFEKLDIIPNTRLVTFLSWFVTFHFVIFLWIFFRAKSFEVAWQMIVQIATQMDWNYIAPFVNVRSTWVIMLVVGYIMHSFSLEYAERITQKFVNSPYWLKIAFFIIAVQLVIQFQSEDVQPFIYFQF
jgi:D-alanyl-lipoteichoic acid acyltransferase DltB (MBOAT superfamily)